MQNLDYNRPIEIADGIFWVGFNDKKGGLHCNPYLIIDHDEAVLIDGGSRPDFPKVMMKILKTGIAPGNITGLIYQHYDPDLCGSLPNLVNIINNDALKVYSTAENHMFIRHYLSDINFVNLSSNNFVYKFKSKRKLKFFKTPFAHASGSFVTFDETSKILFTSDLFGSYSKDWDLFQKTEEHCINSDSCHDCPKRQTNCPFKGMFDFHRATFPSSQILKYAMKVLENIDFEIIAPQHGSILNKAMGNTLIKKLAELDNVGIERYLNRKP
ncbi:MAG: MBL fold metallo-hydrolase [Candidatus Rifleibacteriota bacterium]